jgi:hypothetical protein
MRGCRLQDIVKQQGMSRWPNCSCIEKAVVSHLARADTQSLSTRSLRRYGEHEVIHTSIANRSIIGGNDHEYPPDALTRKGSPWNVLQRLLS